MERVDRRVVPWVAAGPMLQLLRSSEASDIAPGDNTARNTEFGFELAGGIDYRLGPGYLVGELRVGYSDLDHTLTGDSNAGNLALGIGYRVVF